MSPFADFAAYETRFADGLAAMLEAHEDLGVTILVLANAAYVPALWTTFEARLAARHARQAAQFTDALRGGHTLAVPEDDLLVFLKLHLLGFAHIGRPEARALGPWVSCYNPLRGLRPPRASQSRFTGLLQPYNAAGFQFNRPFLAKEIFWEGTLAGQPARLLYNKFPFATLHGLLVPDAAAGYPQYLTAGWLDWAWQVCADAAPGLRLGYNSVGAGASVNHLHFQSFVAPALPIDAADFVHAGGARAYPLPCARFCGPAPAWQYITALHATQTPYNLIFGCGHVDVIARVPHDHPALADAHRGYGWSEMVGVVTHTARAAFDAMDAAAFAQALASFDPGFHPGSDPAAQGARKLG